MGCGMPWPKIIITGMASVTSNRVSIKVAASRRQNPA